MVERLTEGMVLNLHTSDSIDPITGRETNPHIEKEVVTGVKKDFITLFNLEHQHEFKVKKDRMEFYLRRGLYEITDEKA